MNKIVVDKNKCIGCGTCVVVAHKTFKLGQDGKAEVIEGQKEIDDEKTVQEAIDSCPVAALSWEKSWGVDNTE